MGILDRVVSISGWMGGVVSTGDAWSHVCWGLVDGWVSGDGWRASCLFGIHGGLDERIGAYGHGRMDEWMGKGLCMGMDGWRGWMGGCMVCMEMDGRRGGWMDGCLWGWMDGWVGGEWASAAGLEGVRGFMDGWEGLMEDVHGEEWMDGVYGGVILNKPHLPLWLLQ